MWESIDFIVKTMVLCIYLYNLDPIVFKNILKSKFQIYRGRLFESNIGKKVSVEEKTDKFTAVVNILFRHHSQYLLALRTASKQN